MFEELALHLADDPRYIFFQLGVPAGPALPENIRNIPVRVDAERRDEMVEAVAEARIDIVVSWSLWPETFCFMAYEALTGGAFVVARAGSGNVWPAVMANAADQGCVLRTRLSCSRCSRATDACTRRGLFAPPWCAAAGAWYG